MRKSEIFSLIKKISLFLTEKLGGSLIIKLRVAQKKPTLKYLSPHRRKNMGPDEENACYEPTSCDSDSPYADEAEIRRLEAIDPGIQHDGLGTTLIGVVAGLGVEGLGLAGVGISLAGEAIVHAIDLLSEPGDKGPSSHSGGPSGAEGASGSSGPINDY
jgi:hypothetical protein